MMKRVGQGTSSFPVVFTYCSFSPPGLVHHPLFHPGSPGPEAAWSQGDMPTTGHSRRPPSETPTHICWIHLLPELLTRPLQGPGDSSCNRILQGGKVGSRLKNGFAAPPSLCSVIICGHVHSSGRGVHAKSPQSYPSLCDPMDCYPPGSSVHGILQARNTGVGSHSLLQWIFLTQGLNPGLLHCRQIPYFLSLS